MVSNIYIETLKLGSENLDKGISYNKVKECLISKGYSIPEHFENYFILWFFSNFYIRNVSRRIMNVRGHDMKPEELRTEVAMPAILTGEAFQNYLDYLELHEARINSIQAQKTANESIWIARVTLWISAGISIGSMLVNLFL